MTHPHALHAVQERFDQEGRTIEAGRRSFFPERPAGQPSQWVGAVVTIGGFVLLAAIALVTP